MFFESCCAHAVDMFFESYKVHAVDILFESLLGVPCWSTHEPADISLNFEMDSGEPNSFRGGRHRRAVPQDADGLMRSVTAYLESVRRESAFEFSTYTWAQYGKKWSRAANGAGLLEMSTYLSNFAEVAPEAQVNDMPLVDALERGMKKFDLRPKKGTVERWANELSAQTRCALYHVRRIKGNEDKYRQAVRFLPPTQKKEMEVLCDKFSEVPWWTDKTTASDTSFGETLVDEVLASSIEGAACVTPPCKRRRSPTPIASGSGREEQTKAGVATSASASAGIWNDALVDESLLSAAQKSREASHLIFQFATLVCII